MGFKQYLATLFLLALLVIAPVKQAFALKYTMCFTPRDTSSCFIAFQKLLSIANPVNPGKVYFDDGRHFINGELFMFPTYYVAETDLDNDGFNEIITTIPEPEDEMRGWFCKEEYECPHFIFQDRNTNPENLSMKNIKTFGPYFSYGLAPSTDERIDGFLSLRSYKDTEQEKYEVLQYDRKTDDYYNITAPN